MVNAKTGLNVAAREFFQVSLVTYLLLTLAETLKEGFVSNFFNMNYLLLVVLATGLAMVLTEPAETELGQAMEAVKGKVQEAAATTTAGVSRAHRAVRRQVSRPLDSLRRRPGAPVLDLSQASVTPPKKVISTKPPRHPRQLG